MKGYFNINPYLALSLAITIFSFAGIPPLVGFFAKQMVLSAALDSGYVFLTLVAILTSVIGAVYYLGIIKQVFFDKSEYRINPALIDKNLHGNIICHNGPSVGSQVKGLISVPKAYISTLYKSMQRIEIVRFKCHNIALSSSLTITISILTLIILLFIFVPKQWLNLANIIALIVWNT